MYSFFQIWIILFWPTINNFLYFHYHFLLGVPFLNFHQPFLLFHLHTFCILKIFRMWIISGLLWFIIICFSYDFLWCLVPSVVLLGLLAFYCFIFTSSHPTPPLAHSPMKWLVIWNKYTCLFCMYVRILLKPLVDITRTHIWDDQIMISLWFSNHL